MTDIFDIFNLNEPTTLPAIKEKHNYPITPYTTYYSKQNLVVINNKLKTKIDNELKSIQTYLSSMNSIKYRNAIKNSRLKEIYDNYCNNPNTKILECEVVDFTILIINLTQYDSSCVSTKLMYGKIIISSILITPYSPFLIYKKIRFEKKSDIKNILYDLDKYIKIATNKIAQMSELIHEEYEKIIKLDKFRTLFINVKNGSDYRSFLKQNYISINIKDYTAIKKAINFSGLKLFDDVVFNTNHTNSIIYKLTSTYNELFSVLRYEKIVNYINQHNYEFLKRHLKNLENKYPIQSNKEEKNKTFIKKFNNSFPLDLGVKLNMVGVLNEYNNYTVYSSENESRKIINYNPNINYYLDFFPNIYKYFFIKNTKLTIEDWKKLNNISINNYNFKIFDSITHIKNYKIVFKFMMFTRKNYDVQFVALCILDSIVIKIGKKVTKSFNLELLQSEFLNKASNIIEKYEEYVNLIPKTQDTLSFNNYCQQRLLPTFYEIVPTINTNIKSGIHYISDKQFYKLIDGYDNLVYNMEHHSTIIGKFLNDLEKLPLHLKNEFMLKAFKKYSIRKNPTFTLNLINIISSQKYDNTLNSIQNDLSIFIMTKL